MECRAVYPVFMHAVYKSRFGQGVNNKHTFTPSFSPSMNGPRCVHLVLQAENDRVGLLHTLATLEEHPESVPINALVPVDGTPLADEGSADAPDIWDMGRMIATARVVMPRTMVRLSAGRLSFSEAEQVGRMRVGIRGIHAVQL